MANIQNLVLKKDYEELNRLVIANEISKEDLEKSYEHEYDKNKYINNNPDIIIRRDSLLTIAVHNEQIDFVNLLLERNIDINPTNPYYNIHPLELLFNGLHKDDNGLSKAEYNYSDLSELRLKLIETILDYAIRKNIKFDVNKVPFDNSVKGFISNLITISNSSRFSILNHFAIGEPRDIATTNIGNSEENSYLQIICAGKGSSEGNAIKIKSIIKKFREAGADIFFYNQERKLVFDFIKEHEIFETLLDTMSIEESKQALKKYDSFLNKVSSKINSYFKNNLDISDIITESLQQKINRRSNEEAGKAIKILFQESDIGTRDIADTASFVAKYISPKDTRSLNLVCKNIARGNNYIKNEVNINLR